MFHAKVLSEILSIKNTFYNHMSHWKLFSTYFRQKQSCKGIALGIWLGSHRWGVCKILGRSEFVKSLIWKRYYLIQAIFLLDAFV